MSSSNDCLILKTSFPTLPIPDNTCCGSIGGSISCDSEGRIKWILLLGFKTPGSITPAFGNLTNLEILWLYGDKLTGSIPRELGRLTKLTEMGLVKTGLTGPIPRELGGLKNLRQLWLIENQLSGPIPKELEGLPLDAMHLERNYFTGTVPESFSRINKKGISGNCFNNILNATAYGNITQRPFEECERYLPNTVALSLASTPSPNLVYEVAALLFLFVVVSTALTFSFRRVPNVVESIKDAKSLEIRPAPLIKVGTVDDNRKSLLR